jgi:hypothetical protein
MGKKSESGSGMFNPDHIFKCLETIFWVKILKLFDVGPGSGFGKNSDPGWKNVASDINILDPQHCPRSPA